MLRSFDCFRTGLLRTADVALGGSGGGDCIVRERNAVEVVRTTLRRFIGACDSVVRDRRSERTIVGRLGSVNLGKFVEGSLSSGVGFASGFDLSVSCGG